VKRSWPTLFQVLVHLGGIIPLVYLIIRYQTDNLGPNPILELEHETGKIALFFLVLSLACTPARNITGWKEFVRRRKALGLYGALYAFIHFTIFIGLDYGFDLNLVLDEAIRRNFIIVGAIALTILLVLTITSNRYAISILGSNWKKLHRLVYILSPLVILHFAMVMKGNILTLQGNYTLPMIYLVIVIILLMARIPTIARLIRRKTPSRVIVPPQKENQ
jgi:methionine sulfoxide reductase heme-binding subunit